MKCANQAPYSLAEGKVEGKHLQEAFQRTNPSPEVEKFYNFMLQVGTWIY